jgi:hypothetical protein
LGFLLVLKLKTCLGRVQVGLIQAAPFQVDGSYLVSQFPILVVFCSVSLKFVQLLVMKLDDKWRKGFESFLHFWSAKVQELEGIEDKSVCDETKRIWLTNTLSSQSDIDDAICQAISTELTIHGTQGDSGKSTVPWTNFYNMMLLNAKLIDSTRSKQTGRRQETNQANRNTRGNNSNCNNRSRNANQKTGVAYTSPSMVMEPGMHFSPDDWAKLTKPQKNKLLKFKKQKRNSVLASTVSINDAKTTSTSNTPSPTTTASPSTSANNCDIHQLPSNSTSRDSSSVT